MSVKLTSRRITLSSNASDTFSKTTIGDPRPEGLGELPVSVRSGEQVSHQYSSVIRRRVRKKSTTITATDEATTALVVARPTPCVPPLVRSPT